MFDKFSFESGWISRNNSETGLDELKTLYEIKLNTDGICDGRYSGVGFKGSCMTMIDPAFEDSICVTVMDIPRYSCTS